VDPETLWLKHEGLLTLRARYNARVTEIMRIIFESPVTSFNTPNENGTNASHWRNLKFQNLMT
jgi:hypothetical protein